MALMNFRSYQLSVQFYKECLKLRLPAHLKDQMLRASSSICLNLAEGSAKGTYKDRVRFYRIALGSQRECAAILDLISERPATALQLCDQVGAHVYKLVQSPVA
jgi:four helix bundle protein